MNLENLKPTLDYQALEAVLDGRFAGILINKVRQKLGKPTEYLYDDGNWYRWIKLKGFDDSQCQFACKATDYEKEVWKAMTIIVKLLDNQ